MSKTVSTDLKAHLAQAVTTVCTCWKLTRRDGAILYFTDHDADITFNSQTYSSSKGYIRTAVVSDEKMTVDNMEVFGILNTGYIDEHDLRNGVYNYAKVEIFLVNWANLAQGSMTLRKGYFGEVLVTPTGSFKSEIRGLTQALAVNFGETVSSQCRADLGDSRCKVPLSPTTWAASTVYGAGSYVVATNLGTLPNDPAGGLIWYTPLGGTSGSTQPTWNSYSLSTSSASSSVTTTDTTGTLTAGTTVTSTSSDTYDNTAHTLTTVATTITTIVSYDTSGTSAMVVTTTATVTTVYGITNDNTVAWVPYNSFTKYGAVLSVTDRKTVKVGGLTIPQNMLYGQQANALGNAVSLGAPAAPGPLSISSGGFPAGSGFNVVTCDITLSGSNTLAFNASVPGGGGLVSSSGNNTAHVQLKGPLETINAILTQGFTWISSTSLTDTVTVTAFDGSGHTFSYTWSLPLVSTYYKNATVIWITGSNTGKSMEVYSYSTGDVLTLYLSMPFMPQIGDVFKIFPGCDKMRSTCVGFANGVNFHGEPDLPGQDFLFAPNLNF